MTINDNTHIKRFSELYIVKGDQTSKRICPIFNGITFASFKSWAQMVCGITFRQIHSWVLQPWASMFVFFAISKYVGHPQSAIKKKKYSAMNEIH